MVDQIVYEVYALEHRQRITREAETSRIVSRLKVDAHESGSQLGRLRAKLKGVFPGLAATDGNPAGKLPSERKGLFEDKLNDDSIVDLQG